MVKPTKLRPDTLVSRAAILVGCDEWRKRRRMWTRRSTCARAHHEHEHMSMGTNTIKRRHEDAEQRRSGSSHSTRFSWRSLASTPTCPEGAGSSAVTKRTR